MDTSDKVGLALIFMFAIALIAGITLGFYDVNMRREASVMRYETQKEVAQMHIDARK